MKAGGENDLPLTMFLQGLFEDAHARVPNWSQASRKDRVAAANYLQSIHEQLTLEAPAVAPSFHETSAIWAAEVVHWSCWTMLNRIEDNTSLPLALMKTKPSGTTPEEHWSVDLCFRFFASIIEQARRLSHQDSLCITLESIIREWPYSAIGCVLQNLDSLNILHADTVASHDSLLLSMRDRLIERKDRTWIALGANQFLHANKLRELVTEAVGAQKQLLPIGWSLGDEAPEDSQHKEPVKED